MEWIDIYKTLPEHEQYCLVWGKNWDHPLFGIFIEDYGVKLLPESGGMNQLCAHFQITHWAPVDTELLKGPKVE